MSQDDRDQRGGHRRRKSDTYSCQCCPILSPSKSSKNRTERNRTSVKYERRADGAA